MDHPEFEAVPRKHRSRKKMDLVVLHVEIERSTVDEVTKIAKEKGLRKGETVDRMLKRAIRKMKRACI